MQRPARLGQMAVAPGWLVAPCRLAALLAGLALAPAAWAGEPTAAAPAPAAEWWVDGTAPAGGTGTAAAPFRTLAEALARTRGGDTVTVRAGEYPETVALTQSGTAERPTTLRAAPGARVILSGFASVTGWEAAEGGLFSTTVEGAVNDLFVDSRPQPVSRWPDPTKPWRGLSAVDAGTGTLRDRGELREEALLAPLAAAPAAARLLLYCRSGNTFADTPLAALDLATSTLTAGDKRPLGQLRGDGHRYQIVNHVALVRHPGEWAAEPVADGRTRLTFRPALPTDLSRTRFPRADARLLYVGHWQEIVRHVVIEGLEVAGSGGMGIQVGNAEHVTVSRCLVHHNRGAGIAVRRSGFVEVRGNLVLANGNGVTVASSHDVRVEGNEIAGNLVDGLVVAGNVSGRPNGEPTTRDVLVRRNYLHHHLLLGHPDNLQTYRGVENLTLEGNVLLWGGQALMTEETNRSRIRNSILVGTAAVAVIFGHGNASEWDVEGCTIGLGGWGGVSPTGEQYRLYNNIFYQNVLEITLTTSSDYNLFSPGADSQPACLVAKPKWQRFREPAEAAAATGQETHSRRAPAGLRRAPARQAVALWDDRNALDRLFVRQAGVEPPTEGFAAGDVLEINGDACRRRITAVDPDSLAFTPPLAALPLREALLWNWKDAPDFELDLRPAEGSPALGMGRDGRTVGSDLDVGAFRRGDFDGDGRRDLPEVPPDVQAAWPDPNRPVLPARGS